MKWQCCWTTNEARGTLESIIEFVWSEFLGQKDPDSASIERADQG